MCTSPLKGFVNGLTENGKKNLIIASYDVDHIEIINDHKWHCHSPLTMPGSIVLSEWIQIPCGQCAECRLQRSRQWANRCMLELPYHNQSWFITLTYDDEHIPKSECITEDGEYIENGTLRKKDLSDFMKRLRRAYEYHTDNENKLRFFGCGEYGSKTMRPHFHVIVFGLELPPGDLLFYKRNFRGDNYYNSKLVSSCWKNGFSVLGDVSWESCAYVARYIMKKHLGKDSDFYERYNIAPEFTLMSRRPGIAKQYYEDHKDELFNNDFVSVPTNDGSKRIYPPQYFEKLFEMDFPELEIAERKEKRKESAIQSFDQQLKKTDLSDIEYFKVKEYNIENKIKALKREDI